jgi:hypothetical protein
MNSSFFTFEKIRISMYILKMRRFLAGSGKQTKSLVVPALFELYTVKSTRGLELPVILSIYHKPAGNL